MNAPAFAGSLREDGPTTQSRTAPLKLAGRCAPQKDGLPRRNELHEELLEIVRTNPDTTGAKVYSVGTDCLIIKDCWRGCVQVQLAWCRIDRVTLCFVLGSDKALSDYSRVFGNDGCPGFTYFGIHESLVHAWEVTQLGGAGYPQNGAHHERRLLCRYAAACARNLRANAAKRTKPHLFPRTKRPRKGK